MDDDAPKKPPTPAATSVTTAAAWAPLVAEAALTRPSAQALARAALLLPHFVGSPSAPSPSVKKTPVAAEAPGTCITAKSVAPIGASSSTSVAPMDDVRFERDYPRLQAFMAQAHIVPVDDAWPQATNQPATPLVRSGVRRKAAPEAVPQALLEELVDSVHIEAGGVREPQFIVTFREEELGAIRCSLRVGPEGLRAMLEAGDAMTERLLRAEAPRLRAQLEERGLKVVQMEVCRVDIDP